MYALNTPLGRFGIETLEDSPQHCVASIPAGQMTNPLTGAPTVAPLAMLVDHIGGLLNHLRRDTDEWTVSSELSLELAPGAADHLAAAPDVPVHAVARPFGPKTTSALGLCELTHRDTLLATATVRSFYITVPGRLTDWADYPKDFAVRTSLAEKLAVEVAESGGRAQVLMQRSDPVLNNSIGIVHGGVSAMALELVGAAAANAGRDGPPLHTASLRLNYLRQFRGGGESRYVGTALRVGRNSAVADAQAVGDDGRVAIQARLTAYR